MYIILGSDQKEYGPITEEQLCQWIAQRRANPETLVRLENASEWKPLSTFPEFSAALTAVAPGPPALGARPAGVVPVAPKTSGLAVASLVFFTQVITKRQVFLVGTRTKTR